MTPQQMVAIPTPGWKITYDGDGTIGDYVAERKTPITPYQALNGALDQLCANDPGELFILCDAQTRLAERLATAEGLAQADARRREADRDQRITAVRSTRGGGPDHVGSGPGPAPRGSVTS